MLGSLLDYATAISFAALTADVVMQIGRVSRRKSSHDVSYVGIAIRLVGCLALLAKFWSLSDRFLIGGQVLVTIAVTAYLVMVVRHQQPRGPSRR